MVRSWLLRGLLGLMWILPLWMDVMSDKCNALHTIKDQLNITLRRRYMKHNFPINYTIQVRYEEVFRLHNISRLRNEEDVELMHLQNLWLTVAQKGIKRILQVLPEKHPTRRKYLTALENLFRIYEQSYGTEIELPDSIEDIGGRLLGTNYQGWRSVTPKSLLDNCYRTMHCLFKECFLRDGSDYDYCNILHWRKRKGTTPQPT
ncbi:interleukin-34 [Colossoma macropomum]|uniref:interleukin-34 n=1 Tax=Colossoma macropomum TaxID=42526 RepID=UPI0018648F68|nr:interleukin-34 [Colossoma macropomum]XP_036441436.1 interleukin-34 [Colossoma macropomum]